MSNNAARRNLALPLLGIDPATIETVIETAGRVVVTPEGVKVRSRWEFCLSTGELLGYSDATPGVLYWTRKATR